MRTLPTHASCREIRALELYLVVTKVMYCDDLLPANAKPNHQGQEYRKKDLGRSGKLAFQVILERTVHRGYTFIVTRKSKVDDCRKGTLSPAA